MKPLLATTAVASVIFAGSLALADRLEKVEAEKAYQDTYFAERGKYEQKLKQNGKEVHVYEGPKGWGYVIIEETDTEIIHTGYGPEAAERTYRRQKPPYVASTTP
jgi:hypothetical protein